MQESLRAIRLKEFIKKAIEKFGKTYDYTKIGIEAVGALEIVCPKHGSFFQEGWVHLSQKTPCKKCREVDPSYRYNKKLTKEAFLIRAKDKYGNFYDYSQMNFKEKEGRLQKITIICPIHNKQIQTVREHLHLTYGCKPCGLIKISQARSDSTESFIDKASIIHKEKFNYSKTLFSSNKEKVEIMCSKHGSFFQLPGNHTNLEQGCPSCPAVISKPHQYLIDYLDTDLGLIEGVDYLINTRKILPQSRELDLYFPKQQFAVEINGVYWHSIKKGESRVYKRTRHLRKLKLSLENNIQLIQVTDLEIQQKSNIIKSIILNKLGKSIIHYARKCIIKEVSSLDTGKFLNLNHLQGKTRSKIRLGLYSRENELLQIMTFGRARFNKQSNWELIRLCAKLNNSVVGGSDRLFKHFVNNYMEKDEIIISYCDLRVFNGNVYKSLGFKKLRESPPNYQYLYKGSKPVGGRYKFQKHKLEKILGESYDPTKTELSNMLNNNYSILYDCGNSVWEYIKE